ncbi:unnamed protein product, partial [marine sediment metagenome]
MKISIIIIFDKIRKSLFFLLDQIRQQSKGKNVEVVLIHESNEKLKLLKEFKGFKYVNIPEKNGFSFNRNQGLKYSKGDVVVFIDDDCLPREGWLENLIKPFDNKRIDGVMGDVKIPKVNYIGNCISELGFPAGANAGFKRMWKVSQNGFTYHISTCNCALRKKVFSKIGEFNENLIYGAEDAELSYRLEKGKCLIKYQPSALVFHAPRKDLKSFIEWMLR